MKKSEILARVQAICRTRHLSLHTERAYMAQAARFVAFCAARPALVAAEDRVRAWLEDMAPHCAAKTQAQALNAVVFLYRHALEKPLGELGDWSKAKIPRRLPVWLSVSETKRVLSLAEGTRALMLRLTYGCGLRLMEVVRLRVKDVDLERGLITIRGAKGDKDRASRFPFRSSPILAPTSNACARFGKAMPPAGCLRCISPTASNENIPTPAASGLGSGFFLGATSRAIRAAALSGVTTRTKTASRSTSRPPSCALASPSA